MSTSTTRSCRRFDQDLRFGAENLKTALFTVMLLEEHYDGPRHFDAHALRTEDEEGVWAFAAGCMRTYKMLAEKARASAPTPRSPRRSPPTGSTTRRAGGPRATRPSTRRR
jgi:hypothetical protein